jgi:succinyl-diaminopimelate desuccinylase
MLDDILTLTKQLVIIPSTKENNTKLYKVLDVAKKELTGFTIEEFEQNNTPSILVYSGKTRPSQFKVILNAHLDVVPAQERQYVPYEKNGKLYGRGTSDMKAAAAVELLVFKELAQKLNYPIALQLVTDEEIGGFDCTKYQIDKGVKAEFVIAGEPTDLGINNKAKGILWMKVKTKGTSAHGAYPWNGKNAIQQMRRVLEALDKHFPVPKEESWKTTINVATIETTNQTFNKVPDDCLLKLDVRYIPEDSTHILDSIKNILPKDVDVEVVLQEPAQFTDETNEYITKLKTVTKKIVRKQAPVIVKHGGADIRHFNRVGCEGITFGPVGAGLHTDEEWVDIKGLENYYNILKEFLLSL